MLEFSTLVMYINLKSNIINEGCIMSLQEIYNTYLKSGYAGIKSCSTKSGDEFFYLALLAFGEDDLTNAVQYANQAVELEPDNYVFVQGLLYLKSLIKLGKSNVYIDDKGFNAFINGGANISLYKETSNALHKEYLEYESISLFDIGVGDGKALLPAITNNIRHLDLLEPSEVMLKHLCSLLDADHKKLSYNAVCNTFQNFIKGNVGSWDIIQGTYSFHSFPYDERMNIFKWLRQHCKRVLIAEFDVPDFNDMFAPERYKHILKRYLKGLSEYDTDRDLVAQGFLMPVMLGYFDKSINRTTYEQPIQKWVVELENAGFNKVRAKQLYPYWWADAYIIDAS